MTPHQKFAYMSLSQGHVEVAWPLNLTTDDVEDMEEFFRLTLNSMRRQAGITNPPAVVPQQREMEGATS